jgi:hypothetical protein
VVRRDLRYRDELVSGRTTQIQPRQKALQLMKVQLHQVFSNIVGVSGLALIEAILKGERDLFKMAGSADRRVKASQAKMANALLEFPFLIFFLVLLHSFTHVGLPMFNQPIDKSGKLVSRGGNSFSGS